MDHAVLANQELEAVLEREEVQLGQAHLAHGLANGLHAPIIATRLNEVGRVHNHVERAHLERARGVPLNCRQHVLPNLGEFRTQRRRGGGAMQQIRHVGNHQRVNVELVLLHAAALLVEGQALVPVVQQAGKTRLAFVNAVNQRQLLRGFRGALGMVVTFCGYPVLQDLFHPLKVLFAINVFDSHSSPSFNNTVAHPLYSRALHP